MSHSSSKRYGAKIVAAAMARSMSALGMESYAFCVGSMEALLNEIALYHPSACKTLNAYITATPQGRFISLKAGDVTQAGDEYFDGQWRPIPEDKIGRPIIAGQLSAQADDTDPLIH